MSTWSILCIWIWAYFTLYLGHLPNDFCVTSPTKLLHFPNNLLRFPNKIASFPQQLESFPQQLVSFPQHIFSFPQQLCVTLPKKLGMISNSKIVLTSCFVVNEENISALRVKWLIINKNCPTFDNWWKKWQEINESLHNPEIHLKKKII